MSESFSVSIRVVSSFILGEAPGGIYLWGASFCPLGCPLLFFGLGKEKKQKKLHSQGLSARIERALSAPLPSVGGSLSWVRCSMLRGGAPMLTL